MPDRLQAAADVLVIGGGPSATWSALSAALSGARVIQVDKGYVGTSGATAPSNTGTWCVPPEGRAQAVENRWQRTGQLADPRWMLRCVDTAYENLLQLAEWGYPFPSEEDGAIYLANLRGPDYMRFMRRRALLAGVTILDHHPALELLSDGQTITGAAGVGRQTGEDWRIEAGAVVLATGGCAFHERILGGTGLTGDGYLMAAEAGALLSGMEFTGKYTLAPYASSLNKGLPYRWAHFEREDGTPILDRNGDHLVGGLGNRDAEIAEALLGGPVYARLDLADAGMQQWLRHGQPNCFLPYDRQGIDPFTDAFRVMLRAEGTVRGTGGIRLAGEDCRTDVAGLYVAGDAASRENMTGATSGGGAVNASWAIASGWWSGQGAARFARRGGAGRFRSRSAPLGRAGLRPAASARPIDRKGIVAAMREEVVPLEKNFFRHGDRLTRSLSRLDTLWTEIRDHAHADGVDRVKSRETAAVIASARWSLTAAIERTESRGMHRRQDFAAADDRQRHRITLQGVDTIVAATDAPSAMELAS
jgi:succinate dehydrogenase/fumarate reductase flavoprotein subunit